MGREQGIEQGMRALIHTCGELGVSREETNERLRKEYPDFIDFAEEYMEKYWPDSEKKAVNTNK